MTNAVTLFCPLEMVEAAPWAVAAVALAPDAGLVIDEEAGDVAEPPEVPVEFEPVLAVTLDAAAALKAPPGDFEAGTAAASALNASRVLLPVLATLMTPTMPAWQCLACEQ
jgi:hypothetical protein